ncbi:MAG: hypothetical protein IT355_16975 [Gemmatimonadaceae bacterium]|nr:hypothetical protein [Gemmatimonadaceae bacterium]
MSRRHDALTTHTGGVTMRAILRVAVLLNALSTLAGCDSPPSFPRSSPTVVFRTDTTATAYFDTPRNWGDTVWLEYLTDILRAMHEPPLRHATIDSETTVLRFLWSRAFHPSVAVQVTRAPAGCRVVTTVRENDGWTIPTLDSGASRLVRGRMLRHDTVTVDRSTCDDLAARLAGLGLTSTGPYITSRGCDGADWTFERLDARGHALLVRWSPDSADAPAIWNAGMAFLSAANARPTSPREMY